MILYLDTSALIQRHRERVAGLNSAWESFVRIEVTETVLRLAGEAAQANELRLR